MSGSQNRKMPFALQPHPAAAPPVDSGSSGSGLRTETIGVYLAC